jgi:O-antigen/teichoic acid export membrane protein
MKATAFFKHATVFGLCSICVQAGGVVLLPLYTRCLDPRAYGLLEIIGRLAETVSMCLLVGGMRQALLTFYRQGESDLDRRQVVCGMYALLGVVCTLGGLLAMLFAGPLSRLLGDAMEARGELSPTLLRLAFLAIVLEPLTLTATAVLQARLWSVRFLVLTLLQLLMRVGLSVLFVAVLGWGMLGVVLATALTGLVFASVLTVCELRRGLAWPGVARMKEMVVFALPFLPGSVCFFLLHHGDRFLLMRFGPEEVGFYGLGYRLAQIVAAFSLAPLCQVWYSQLYSVAKTDEAPAVFGRAFTRILSAYAFAAIGLTLFRHEAVMLLAGSRYRPAAEVIIPVLIACFFQSAASLMDAGFYVKRRTGMKLAVTGATTGVMLALYIWLIPAYRAQGAALATLGGFACLALLTWIATQRIFPVEYEWKRLAGILGLCVLAWGASCLALPGAWGFAFKCLLWLLIPFAAWRVGLISEEEKVYLHTVANHVWQRSLALLKWDFRNVGQAACLPGAGGAGQTLALPNER